MPKDIHIGTHINIGSVAIRSSKVPTIEEAITKLVASGQRPGRGGTIKWRAFHLLVLQEVAAEENARGFSLDYVQRVYAGLKRRPSTL